MILTLRTDKQEAEAALFDGNILLCEKKWQAHRELSATLHATIESLLQDVKKSWGDLSGVVVYAGPGSFTGLRIGFSVANALGYALEIPVVSYGGDTWKQEGVRKVQNQKKFIAILPEYGAPIHTTTPKK